MSPPAQCTVLPAALIASYADGSLGQAAAWSVEAHIPDCPACREVLAARVDAAVLARNRSVVLARTGLPEPGRAGRALRRCGLPDHIGVLLAATPSLRRSWLAAVVAVLAVIIGCTRLAAFVTTTLATSMAHGTVVSTVSNVGSASWGGLVPFFVLAPLLPLAAVAGAFSPVLDPSWQLTAAAPVSKIWLLCVRSATVAAASLVPAALSGLALPGPGWLGAALLLPSLAICAAALALATIVRPAAAVAGVAASWIALVIAAAHATRAVATLGSPAGQAGAAAVVAAALTLFAARRNNIDYRLSG
jgi:hypothetical protein